MHAGRGSFWGRVAVSLGLLAVLLLLVDRGELARRLAGARPGFLLLIVALITADRLLMAWKWWLLVRGRDAAVSLWASIRAYYVASFAGWFLPMTVGADAVRIAALAGGGRTAGLVASVVLERIIGALAQAVLAGLALLFLLRYRLAAGLGSGIGPIEGWVLAGSVVAVFLAFPLSFRLAGWTSGRLGSAGDWPAKLGALATAYAAYGRSMGLVAAFFALTLLEGGFPVAIHYAAGRAIGLDPGWGLFVATVPIVFLVARLPVSLGGLGVLEVSFVYLSGLLGLGQTEAFSIGVVAEILLLISLLPGAIAYVLPSGMSLAVRPRARLP